MSLDVFRRDELNDTNLSSISQYRLQLSHIKVSKYPKNGLIADQDFCVEIKVKKASFFREKKNFFDFFWLVWHRFSAVSRPNRWAEAQKSFSAAL